MVNNQKESFVESWGKLVLTKVLHPLILVVTPIFILVLLIYLNYRSFSTGFWAGIRSLAGILFPLFFATLLFIYKRELINRLRKTRILYSSLLSFLIGIILMVVIKVFGTYDLASKGVPIAEIVLSGSLSLLVWTNVGEKDSKALSYYYGMILGILFYIIIWGFPVSY